MVELTQLEIICGFASLVQILISSILGSIMIIKYFRYRDRNLLLMGIAVILVTEPWWPYPISIILILTTGESLPLSLYILIGHGLISFGIVILMTINANLMWYNKQKMIISLSIVFAVIYQIMVLYAVFIDPLTFATLEGPLDVRYKSLILLFHIILLITVIISVSWYLRVTRKSVEKEIRLKGTLYFLSGLSYAIAAILDGIAPLSLIQLVIVRILLILASFENYCTFAMPDWIKKIFLKKK